MLFHVSPCPWQNLPSEPANPVDCSHISSLTPYLNPFKSHCILLYHVPCHVCFQSLPWQNLPSEPTNPADCSHFSSVTPYLNPFKTHCIILLYRIPYIICASPCQSLPLMDPPFRTCKPCGLFPFFFPHTILEPIQEPLYTTILCPLCHMCFPMSVLAPDRTSLQNLQTLRIVPIFLPSHHTWTHSRATVYYYTMSPMSHVLPHVSPCPWQNLPSEPANPADCSHFSSPHTILEPIKEPMYTTIPCPLSCVLPHVSPCPWWILPSESTNPAGIYRMHFLPSIWTLHECDFAWITIYLNGVNEINPALQVIPQHQSDTI